MSQNYRNLKTKNAGVSDFVLKIKLSLFRLLSSYQCFFVVIKVTIFRGDLADALTKTEALTALLLGRALWRKRCRFR